MFRAIATTRNGINELAVMPISGDVSIPAEAFDLSGRSLQFANDAVSRLKKLNLDLHWNRRCDIDALNHRTIAGILRQGVNLEILMITGRNRAVFTSEIGPRITIFEAVLDGCDFPKLQSLYLSGFSMKFGEFKVFLDTGGSSRSFTLSYIVPEVVTPETSLVK